MKTILLLLSLTFIACSPRYTEKQARVLFGCRQDSSRVDSFITHTVDSVLKVITLPGETIEVNGPCEEIAKMKAGGVIQKKGSRTTAVYGKDSTGKSFFNCLADEYKDSLYNLRDRYNKLVTKTIFHSQPQHIPSKWEKFQDRARDVGCFIGLIAVVLLVLKYWRG